MKKQIGRFIVFTLLSGFVSLLPIPAEVSAATNLLKSSDLSCAGVFLTPGVGMGGRSLFPITFRYEADGKRHYFMYDGTGHIVEFPEPSLSPCNTPLTAVNRATYENWGGDWGVFDVNGGDHFIPGQGSSYAFGMHYDKTLSRLLLIWSNTYMMAGNHNTFAGATLNNTTHTLNREGCWAVSGTTMPLAGSGMLDIPSSFVSANLPSGARYGIGFGGAITSYTGGISLGPSLIAIRPPTSNACAPNTDYFGDSGTTLSYYPVNNNGPTCAGVTLGCTPTQAPTPPYPAKMAFTKYSKLMYAPDWDPYDGHGWFGFGTGFGMGWYDDGAKSGIVVPVSTPEGWADTLIVASPAPTFDNPSLSFYRTGTMYVASTGTHDGLNMNPGDKIWIQTCRPGIDPNCETVNFRHFSTAIVDSVTPGTGRVAFHILDGDFGAGDQKPVVGGHVYLGCIYAHGMPDCSRLTFRLQIYDPAQYAEVVRGTRQSYDVTYNEETDLTPLVPGVGCPACGSGVAAHHGLGTLIDSDAHQVLMVVSQANSPLYSVGHAIYVLNVGSGPTSNNPTASISASPSSITPGSSSTLFWSSNNATSVSISPGVGAVGTSGSRSVSPTAATTYTITATNSQGSASSQTIVSVGSASASATTAPTSLSPPPAPASPVPAGGVSDSFNRGDSNSIGSNWTYVYGGNQSLNGGVIGITGNRAYSDGITFGLSAAYWSANTFDSDQSSQFTIGSIDSCCHSYVGVRMIGSGHSAGGKGYLASKDGAILKLDINGSFTTLAAGDSKGAVGDIIKISVAGNKITSYRNGALIASINDNSFASGSAGLAFYWYGTHSTIDNWQGGNLTSQITPPALASSTPLAPTPPPAPAPAPATTVTPPPATPTPKPAPTPAPAAVAPQSLPTLPAQAPVVSNVNVTQAAPNGVITLSWQTNVATTGLVEYAATAAALNPPAGYSKFQQRMQRVLDKSSASTSMGTVHSITIPGAQFPSNTPIYYTIKAVLPNGSLSTTTATQSLTTK